MAQWELFFLVFFLLFFLPPPPRLNVLRAHSVCLCQVVFALCLRMLANSDLNELLSLSLESRESTAHCRRFFWCRLMSTAPMK